MPRKPKRGCAYPGCPRLTDGQYCEEHRKLVDSQYNKYSRSPDVHKTYGRAWKRIRDRYAAEHPLCERCLKEGRITLPWKKYTTSFRSHRAGRMTEII